MGSGRIKDELVPIPLIGQDFGARAYIRQSRWKMSVDVALLSLHSALPMELVAKLQPSYVLWSVHPEANRSHIMTSAESGSSENYFRPDPNIVRNKFLNYETLS